MSDGDDFLLCMFGKKMLMRQWCKFGAGKSWIAIRGTSDILHQCLGNDKTVQKKIIIEMLSSIAHKKTWKTAVKAV